MNVISSNWKYGSESNR